MKWNELGGPRLEGKEAADYACQIFIFFSMATNTHIEFAVALRPQKP